jgi:two-component system, cell cycle sensor histidine kinase and response regulator CckA
VLEDFPPLYDVDQGRPRGFAIDLVKEVAARAGFEPVFVPVRNWEEAEQALREGKVDFVPGIGITEQRAQEFAFSNYIETVPVSLFVRSSDHRIHTLDDATLHGVAVLRAGGALSFLQDRGRPKWVEYATLDEAIVSVLAGEVDALAFPEPVLWQKLQELELESRFKTLSPPLFELHRGYMFPKTHAAMVDARINPAIRAVVHSGSYPVLHRKWYGSPERGVPLGQVVLGLGALVLLGAASFYVTFSVMLRRKNRVLRRSHLERERAQALLEQSEERYRLLFEQAPIGIAVARCDGTLVFGNPLFSSMFGYENDALQGISLSSLHPEPEWKALERLLQCEESTQPLVIESASCRSQDGRLFRCRIQSVPMRVGSAETRVSFYTDVTEELRLEDEGRRSERLALIGQLAGGVAHDFNNQLAGILGYAEILRHDLVGQPEHVESVEGIISAAGRAGGLTRQLLAFARKIRHEQEVVDVATLVREVAELLRHTLDRRIVLDLDLESHPATVLGDPGQLENALLNLALNARDAMPDGGTLRIRVETLAPFPRQSSPEVAHGWIKIEISDTGVGMTEDVRARAFEPFFTTKPIGAGTGMGLSAVWGTVTSHRGRVELSSQPGQGTTVTLFLPRCAKDVTPVVSTADPSGPLLCPSYQVLLVDDEPMIRDVASRMLTRAGARVWVAGDGVEAVERFADHRYQIDLVILDMVMPKMDGHEAFRRIRAIDPDARVLIASGRLDIETMSSLLEEGVLHVLGKPYRRTELLDAVRLVARRPRQGHTSTDAEVA